MTKNYIITNEDILWSVIGLPIEKPISFLGIWKATNLLHANITLAIGVLVLILIGLLVKFEPLTYLGAILLIFLSVSMLIMARAYFLAQAIYKKSKNKEIELNLNSEEIIYKGISSELKIQPEKVERIVVSAGIGHFMALGRPIMNIPWRVMNEQDENFITQELKIEIVKY